MNFKFNQKFTKNLLLILITTFTYSIIVGSGFYGYGNDYYAAYYKQNLNWGTWNNQLGYRIATFSIFGKNYGVYILSAISAFSSGILINTFFKIKKINSTTFFLVIYILTLHTWPIIMSTSNAMRQGITMSLMFLCFVNLLNQKYLKAFIFVTISIFTHTSGIIYFIIFLSIWISKLIFNLKLNKTYKFFIFFLFCRRFKYFYSFNF